MLILIQYIGVEAHHCEADQGIPLKMCENNTMPQSNLAYLKNISIALHMQTGDFFFAKCKILNFFNQCFFYLDSLLSQYIYTLKGL